MEKALLIRRRFVRVLGRTYRRASREHPGKILGLAVGSVGGWFGAVFGLLVGAMVDSLLVRNRADRATAAYLENPGPSDFLERAPGSAAYCALAFLIVKENGTSASSDEAVASARVCRSAETVLDIGPEARSELEAFARVAAGLGSALNPDLLAESLSARRKEHGDGEKIAGALAGLADKDRSKELAGRIAGILAPGVRVEPRPDEDDPYSILGVTQETSIEEIKAVFRILAVQFHPDSSIGLDPAQERSAAEAFIRIEKAYRKILRRARREPRSD